MKYLAIYIVIALVIFPVFGHARSSLHKWFPGQDTLTTIDDVEKGPSLLDRLRFIFTMIALVLMLPACLLIKGFGQLLGLSPNHYLLNSMIIVSLLTAGWITGLVYWIDRSKSKKC